MVCSPQVLDGVSDAKIKMFGYGNTLYTRRMTVIVLWVVYWVVVFRSKGAIPLGCGGSGAPSVWWVSTRWVGVRGLGP